MAIAVASTTRPASWPPMSREFKRENRGHGLRVGLLRVLLLSEALLTALEVGEGRRSGQPGRIDG